MKKALSILLAVFMLLALMAACAADTEENSPAPGGNSPAEGSPIPSPSPAPIVDEDPDLDGVVFKETRQISVEVFERNKDIRTPADNNVYTDYIKAEVLKAHNIEVTEFISMPRWEEDSTIPLWLAGGDCPDVCVTYAFQAIQEYANMGAVIDLAPLVDGYRDRLPNLWDLLGENNVYGARNPETGVIYWLETMKSDNSRINTFVREDWLTKLGISAPTTIEEFEAMLVSFKDNAELLLGDQAARMVPFSLGRDVGWRAENLFASFIDGNMSDRDLYVLGYDDRHFLYPGYKEGVRKLNEWYNNDLVWKDFSIYGSGDSTEDDMMKAGYVGAFIHNWDYPYRENPSMQVMLKEQAGADAAYIAIDPFVNNVGNHMKYMSGSFDRKIFFPTTNDEPKASIFYVDFISRPDFIQYMQLGVEGITYELNDEGVPVLFADPTDPNYILNSGQNIDYTMTINGYYPAGLTAKAISTGYAGTAPEYITAAITAARNDGFVVPQLNLGEIVSESGMGEALKNKRDTLLNQAVNASVADFDSVYDAGMSDYLATGGQAIIDERAQKYDATFGG